MAQLKSGALPAGHRQIRYGWEKAGILEYRRLNPLLPFMTVSSKGSNTNSAGGVINVGNNVELSTNALTYAKEVDSPYEVILNPHGADPYGTGTHSYGFDTEMYMKNASFEFFAPERWDNLLRGRSDFTSAEAEARKLIPLMQEAYNRVVIPQILFDNLQSNAEIFHTGIDQSASMNRIEYSAGSFGFNDLRQLHRIASEGRGFSDPEKVIAPLTPIGGFKENYVETPSYYLFCDDDFYNEIMSSADFQTAILNDVRGANGMVFSATIDTRIANIKIVKMPSYRGIDPNLSQGTFGTNTPFTTDGIGKTTSAGMRQYDTDAGVWQGHLDFRWGHNRISRAVLVGANAIFYDKGREPFSAISLGNYDQKGSAATFVDLAVKKAVWSQITEDTKGFQTTGVDAGIITIDLHITP